MKESRSGEEGKSLSGRGYAKMHSSTSASLTAAQALNGETRLRAQRRFAFAAAR